MSVPWLPLRQGLLIIGGCLSRESQDDRLVGTLEHKALAVRMIVDGAAQRFQKRAFLRHQGRWSGHPGQNESRARPLQPAVGVETESPGKRVDRGIAAELARRVEGNGDV